MTRVIHTGDTHVGYQQYHSAVRRQDFLDAFQRVVDDAVEAGVDAVVHAGDLFHDRRPELVDILGTLSALRDLADADIPFLAVVGNHETKRDAQWLDLFESLGLATRLGSEPVVLGDVAFYGLDFVPRSQRDALAYDFEPHDADHAALVTHGLFQPFAHGDWDASEVLTESNVAFDAMLLGDNHAPGRKEVEGAWVTYCGSTERASAEERDDRGYNIVEFEEEVRIRRRGLPTREFVFVDVELAPGEGVERVVEQVTQYDLADAVGIVTIEGDGERIAPAHVEEVMDERGALVARVNDRREFEDAREVEVRFTDPDEAVRERVRDLGLSQAARDIDEVVRASKVADTNVTDAVEDRVQELLDDPAAFESAPPESEDGAEVEGGEDDEADDREARGSDDETDDRDATAEPDEAGTDDEPTDVGPESGEESDEREPAESDPTPGDGQTTLGDL